MAFAIFARILITTGINHLTSKPTKENINTKLRTQFQSPKPKTARDSIILPTVEEMHSDSKYFDSPKEFRPERFLNDDGKFEPPKTGFLPFGTVINFILSYLLDSNASRESLSRPGIINIFDNFGATSGIFSSKRGDSGYHCKRFCFLQCSKIRAKYSHY
ncbi:putative cytochrome [Armadillidium vulgare]|nr:putative cytochrome [Armadillidium vulgare]